MSKLWIIGDSFTGFGNRPNKNWVQQVSDKFKGESFIVKSKPSRDFQTILDIFLRNLKNISKDDFVILVVPTLSRVRLPRYEKAWDIEYTNLKIEFETIDTWEGDNSHFDYFIGSKSYRKETPFLDFRLAEPFFELEDDEVDKMIQTTEIINDSDASKENYIEILKSLKEYLPFEIFIWSWNNEIESDIIINKNQIEKEIGFWHTIYDEWKETNGLVGTEGDHHFSKKMHNAFANYLINKFPQFFNV